MISFSGKNVLFDVVLVFEGKISQLTVKESRWVCRYLVHLLRGRLVMDSVPMISAVHRLTEFRPPTAFRRLLVVLGGLLASQCLQLEPCWPQFHLARVPLDQKFKRRVSFS